MKIRPITTWKRFGIISLLLALAIALASIAPLSRVYAQTKADLSGIKTYLLDKAGALQTGAGALKKASDAYYALAKAANFDYAGLWKAEPTNTAAALKDAKAAWLTISPLYEQIEGIVAGVPVLKRFDPILDSGVKDEVEFDLTLPDGKTLEKPGNLFGLLETSLWGTEKQYVAMPIDLDGNGTLGFGEVMPDAVFVKGFADSMAQYTAQLTDEGKRWNPTEAEAFTALVVMVPTMKEYFNAWKESRFILGDQATTAEFAVISRLADITDIVGSLEVIYAGVSPMVVDVDPTLDRQIAAGLVELRTYAGDLHKQELAGKKFTPEQADIFAAEAQANADTITGKIAQVAAQLDIKLES